VPQRHALAARRGGSQNHLKDSKDSDDNIQMAQWGDDDDDVPASNPLKAARFLGLADSADGHAALEDLRDSARHLAQFGGGSVVALALSMSPDELEQSFDYDGEDGLIAGGYRVGTTRVEATPSGSEASSNSGPVLGAPLNFRDVVMLGKLGTGQNGTVHKALFVSSLKLVALKTVSVYDKSQRHQFLNELKAFDSLSLAPANLVQFVGAYASEGRVTMALEYMNLGSLRQLVNKKGALTESVIAHLAKQVLLGLVAMHAKHQIHRDIKPDNILVRRTGEAKLSDFGLTKTLSSADDLSNTFVGTLCYFSPERVHQREAGLPSDVWSFGVTLVFLATGKTPTPGGFWEIKSFLDPSARAREWLPPSSYSKDFHSFVHACLEPNPHNRASASALLLHPFLAAHARDGPHEAWPFAEPLSVDPDELALIGHSMLSRYKASQSSHASNMASAGALRGSNQHPNNSGSPEWAAFQTRLKDVSALLAADYGADPSSLQLHLQAIVERSWHTLGNPINPSHLAASLSASQTMGGTVGASLPLTLPLQASLSLSRSISCGSLTGPSASVPTGALSAHGSLHQLVLKSQQIDSDENLMAVRRRAGNLSSSGSLSASSSSGGSNSGLTLPPTVPRLGKPSEERSHSGALTVVNQNLSHLPVRGGPEDGNPHAASADPHSPTSPSGRQLLVGSSQPLPTLKANGKTKTSSPTSAVTTLSTPGTSLVDPRDRRVQASPPLQNLQAKPRLGNNPNAPQNSFGDDGSKSHTEFGTRFPLTPDYTPPLALAQLPNRGSPVIAGGEVGGDGVDGTHSDALTPPRGQAVGPGRRLAALGPNSVPQNPIGRDVNISFPYFLDSRINSPSVIYIPRVFAAQVVPALRAVLLRRIAAR
jgi:serine/threonine protein kinase